MSENDTVDPAVADLDFSCFGSTDLLNIILQRSRVLWDVPRSGRVIRAWMDGDPGPIEAEVERLGTEIARRAAGIIYSEFVAMRPTLDGLAP